MREGRFVMICLTWDSCRCFYWLLELVLHDVDAASGVAAVEVVVAAAVHTAVEIFVVWTFAVDLDLGVRSVAAAFVDVAHAVAVVPAAAAAGLDVAHAAHDVVVAVAADVEAVAVDNASPLPSVCLDFVGAAASELAVAAANFAADVAPPEDDDEGAPPRPFSVADNAPDFAAGEHVVAELPHSDAAPSVMDELPLLAACYFAEAPSLAAAVAAETASFAAAACCDVEVVLPAAGSLLPAAADVRYWDLRHRLSHDVSDVSQPFY